MRDTVYDVPSPPQADPTEPDHAEYFVRIERLADGATKVSDYCASEFYWSDGNGACDCSRAHVFGDLDHPCSDTKYRIIEWIVKATP